jgi:hypothetical protein
LIESRCSSSSLYLITGKVGRLDKEQLGDAGRLVNQ